MQHPQIPPAWLSSLKVQAVREDAKNKCTGLVSQGIWIIEPHYIKATFTAAESLHRKRPRLADWWSRGAQKQNAWLRGPWPLWAARRNLDELKLLVHNEHAVIRNPSREIVTSFMAPSEAPQRRERERDPNSVADCSHCDAMAWQAAPARTP